MFENGVWCFIGVDGTTHVNKYYCSTELGRWCDPDAHPRRNQCTHQSQALTTRLLAYLNSIWEGGKWCRRTVKHWFYHDATCLYVGNCCMKGGVDMELEVTRRYEEDKRCMKAARRCLFWFFCSCTHLPPARPHPPLVRPTCLAHHI